MTNLVETLSAAGKPAESLRNPDGSTVLVLPHGGRVIGLFAPGSDRNFYWTNSALGSVDSAKAFFASDEWQNTGGDRTWLAPEVDLFLPNYPSLDTYFQPRQLDPGKYEALREGGITKLVNRLTVDLARSKASVELLVTKSVGPAPNPLRYERGLSLEGLEYAGYTQHTSLETTSEKGRVGLWNLVQMPHGGDLLVPTYSRSEPKVYFGAIPPADIEVGDRLIRYRMRQNGEHKIGIRGVATCGRVGYLFEQAGTWQLIVRNFAVNPSGEYVDCPWSEEGDLGYSTQACNINGALGQFSELEYHVPAIGEGTGRMRCDDESQVWAFRGSEEAIRSVARTLLGSEA
jgi:hypothetical protein